jgi:predicted transcriptional regulator
MAPGADPLQFVLSSSVRADLLRNVAEGSRSTDDLLDSIDASSSAIYNALGRLEEAGLLTADGETWNVTGSGRLVADFVRRRNRMGSLLGEAETYFATHDLGAIPEEFRLRMSELAGAEVLQASETEPQRVIRQVAEHFESAEQADVLSPIYAETFGDAVPTSGDSRLLLDAGIVEMAVDTTADRETLEAELADWAEANVRVDDVDFALAVTDDVLLLSLPNLDGSYDARTEFVVEHERGRGWGTELFEHFWAAAEPLGPHVRSEYL